MVDNHSSSEWNYRARWIAPLLHRAVSDHPVVVLTGARQTGKSTLLQNEEPFRKWPYRTLDDFDVRRQAEADPVSIWEGFERIVLDEVQHVPSLLAAVKSSVDRRPRRLRFILSGSANLLLMAKVGETLAGRAIYFPLLPMTLGEMLGRPAPTILSDLLKPPLADRSLHLSSVQDPVPSMLKGFMPALLTLSRPEAVLRWWEGYVATYLERDLRQISQVAALSDFRLVMEMAALRTGQMLNQTEISRDARVSQPSVHRYLNLLEAGHLLVRVPAFARNRAKRLIKTPKIYWMDPALPVFLAGYHDPGTLRTAREVGGFFENLVFLHLQALAQSLIPRPRIYYWRTTTGTEVDFVVESGRRLLAIEVKMTTSPHHADVAGLRAFLDEYPETTQGVLVHGGGDVKRFSERIIAIPWSLLAAQ